LEFDTVFIVGAEDGIFPGVRSIGEIEDMEEERRLCYVAMTRAKRRLFFIHAKQRMLFGKTSRNKLSRFVEEVAGEHIVKPEITHRAAWEFLSGRREGAPPEARGFARETPGIRRPLGERGAGRHEPPAAREPIDFAPGDAVLHRAFGEGVVKSITQTGGDALVEIVFEGTGKKRLMLKAAAAYMKKI
jgi:DNA helicase-2/ATP-dependent DNA helicase PcrA